jgi:hypothetical protein
MMPSDRVNRLAGDARQPAFTVGTALRWLGHDCPGQRCWRPLESLDASVWFLLDRQQSFALPKTRVLVELSITGVEVSHVRRVFDEVNWCTRRDAIEVGYRPSIHGRPMPSPTPVSHLRHYRPSRLDDDAGPSELDLEAIRYGAGW